MCCDCLHSVPLPHGAVGWSAVCDCGYSLSYLLTYLYNIMYSYRSVLQYFRPSLSYHLSLRPFFCLFLLPFCTGFTVHVFVSILRWMGCLLPYSGTLRGRNDGNIQSHRRWSPGPHWGLLQRYHQNLLHQCRRGGLGLLPKHHKPDHWRWLFTSSIVSLLHKICDNQSLRCPAWRNHELHWVHISASTLIWPDRCQCWSESSLGTHGSSAHKRWHITLKTQPTFLANLRLSRFKVHCCYVLCLTSYQ